jgi:hypothetical protein
MRVLGIARNKGITPQTPKNDSWIVRIRVEGYTPGTQARVSQSGTFRI